MSTAYRITMPIATLHDYVQPVTALSFDPVSDTLWSGTNAGTVIALHTVQGLRGVSFPVAGEPAAVKQIVAGDNYVRALGVAGEGIGSWAKGGMNKWFFRSSSTLTAFSSTTYTSNILAASTTAPELVLLNAITGNPVRVASSSSIATHLQFSHSTLLAASADGYVRVHDPRTCLLRENGENSVLAHISGVQDLQASGNYFYTIGWSVRRGHDFPDPLVKVYDHRTMRPLPPIPFQDGPAFINILPKHASSLVVTSAQGLVNVVDVSDYSNVSGFYQLETASYISATAVSSNGSFLAFGDALGAIHLMTAIAEDVEPLFNGFEGQPVEWADPPDPLPDITWTDSTPLNSIGMPYYNTLLLSSWTPQFLPRSGILSPPPPKIPPQVLSTMKMNDNIAYAALPKELRGRRNRVPVTATKDQGRFRSGKGRRDDLELEALSIDDSVEEVPRIYRKVEIEYSKFGVEDFDFGFYNKTPYSGLETHILNSYTNPMLQVMHYIHPIRCLAKSHITTNCPREHCLLCELGFVARMLEDAGGTNCQGSNFCKTVGVLAQSQNQIELIDYGREPTEVDYAHMIQSFHRFFVDHLSIEGNAFPHNPRLIHQTFQEDTHSPAAAPITQLLGIDAKTIITCISCKAVREKENMTHVVDMVYPRRLTPSDPPPATDFASILRASLIRQMTHKATCQTCKQFATFSSRRSISSSELPPVLAVNASVYNEDNLKLWLDNRQSRFLSPTVEVRGEVEGVDEVIGVVYELKAMVVQIMTKARRSHLVAIVKVPEAEGQSNLKSPWFLFNDFVVRNISEEEALSFPSTWKVPAVLYFERIDVRQQLDYSGLPQQLDPSILSLDTSISVNRDENIIRHECLSFEELPKPGTLVAIDAEFVSMQQEETEYRSNGTHRVIRPARLSLARVSVLRGDGSKEGVPFIDDHIHTSEVIVDYLTEFSGIKFGDLDPHLSRYTLTPLKLVYKKLRVLVDRGCIFIGHGLSKDFRIINIFVPPEQVIDTVDLYFLRSRQRRLSLRFLSWFVLHEHIQTDTHDSIEDARSALRLYKAYYDFEERRVFDDKLEELYREGKQYNWKPPPQPDVQPNTTRSPIRAAQTPPIPQFSMMNQSFAQPQFNAANFPAFFAPSDTQFGVGGHSQNWNNPRHR
ncbi:hypothetical protein AZE42_08691 [Rhizopogon vesiculosus]|uniref:PAN2-PAN3 deadenylation complex catalytic subunit PAN2 n=1 Tax=Rhizopogon vesiculosus TaxID=180088 RepID=A0A1J8QQF3_9AGAM|nr:hypothetical protein AZE42_08691 [Rhizopogon vesiculosus]